MPPDGIRWESDRDWSLWADFKKHPRKVLFHSMSCVCRSCLISDSAFHDIDSRFDLSIDPDWDGLTSVLW